MSIKNPIKVLTPEVARKIAAGEVIDRPNAIVRELIDNSLDSGATEITVEINDGGIEKIRVIDDGYGMTKEDLQTCAHPHATSKISTEIDLLNLSTMGFRGEALASIAAVSRLSIISGGWKMKASITEDHILEPTTNIKGTIVQSEGLFENFPARRQFLKRNATEALMCKNTFVEKSLARPDVAFKLIIDGEIKINLPKNQTLKERFIDANNYKEDKQLFLEISNKSTNKTDNIFDWEFNLIIGEPSIYRSNKKEISIFVNKRKIQEYSLIQAIEYGTTGFFPNGTYPVCSAFINVNPKLVDFNIHPAKKEARFYDISDLHHGISVSLKEYFLKNTNSFITEESELKTNTQNFFSFPNEINLTQKQTQNSFNPNANTNISYKTNGTYQKSFNDIREKYFSTNEQTSFTNLVNKALNINNDSDNKTFEQEEKIKFIGKCLGTFLLAEKDQTLYIFDQHAAHERIIFDKIMNNQGNFQNLLIPYKIKTESKTQDNLLEKLQPSLCKIGFNIQKKDEYWEVTTISDRWTGSELEFRNLIFVKQSEPEEIIRSIAAMTACKAAVKDGYFLDDITSLELIKEAFTLKDPHCPHGRPIYTAITREKLFELVKRT